MISKTTPEFWRHYALLPERAQRLADKCYRLWQSNPNHRSIRFKRLKGHPTLHSARVGIHYRAIAQREDDLMIGFGSVIIRNTTRCFASGERVFEENPFSST